MAVIFDDGMWALKLKALLHDPPQKAGVLFRQGLEPISKRLYRLLDLTEEIPDQVRKADHLAAGADRFPVPRDELYRAEFERSPHLTHPLSGRGISLGPLKSTRWEKVGELVEEVIREICGRYPAVRERYLAVWRLLPKMLEDPARAERAPNDHLGLLWRFMPADTRIPDHSIWEHNRVTSAFVGALPEPGLFRFSLGPVQPFIAAARKTSDLWAGSSLLAQLAGEAILAVVERFGPDAVIFPDIWGNPLVDGWLADQGLDIRPKPGADRIPCIPNQFLALIPRSEARATAEAAARRVSSRLENLAKNAIESISTSAVDTIRRHVAEAFETYWGCLPYKAFFDKKDGDLLEWWKTFNGGVSSELLERIRDHYAHFRLLNSGIAFGDASRLSASALASAKATRTAERYIEPAGKPRESRRCLLCGERTAVDAHSKESGRGFLSEGERLCGLCLVKRWYGRQGNPYPSTAGVAASSWLVELLERMNEGDPDSRRLKQEFSSFAVAACDIETAWVPDRVLDVARDLRDQVKFEGRLLFENEYAEDEEIRAHEKAEEVRRKLRQVSKVAAELGLHPKPRRYYAVLVGDGDDMGKWLSGVKCPVFDDVVHPDLQQELSVKEVQRPYAPGYQAALSRALRDFAGALVPAIVEQCHAGVLVYAGGDDFFALAPVRDCIRMALDLRNAFSGRDSQIDGVRLNDGFAWIGAGRKQELLRVMGPEATLSAGIALGHYKSPMRVVVEAARQAEGIAKKVRGKDSMCIAVLKRSGEREFLAIRWEAVPLLQDFANAFGRILGRRSWYLSPRLIRDLADIEPLLSDQPDHEITRAEVLRLLCRHLVVEDPANSEETRSVGLRCLKELGDRLLASMREARNGDKTVFSPLTGPRRVEGFPAEYFSPSRQAVRLVAVAAFLAREEEEE